MTRPILRREGSPGAKNSDENLELYCILIQQICKEQVHLFAVSVQ